MKKKPKQSRKAAYFDAWNKQLHTVSFPLSVRGNLPGFFFPLKYFSVNVRQIMLEKYIEPLCSNNFSEIPCFSDYCISGYVRITFNFAFFTNHIFSRN